MKTVCYRDCWDHSPTAYSDMTTKPPTHSVSAAHPEMPKAPPFVDLNTDSDGKKNCILVLKLQKLFQNSKTAGIVEASQNV